MKGTFTSSAKLSSHKKSPSSRCRSPEHILPEIKAGLAFLQHEKYTIDTLSCKCYFNIKEANQFWKDSKEIIYTGRSELEEKLALPMNRVYDDNVEHKVRLTGKYAKITCATNGCHFQVWYKPQDTEMALENSQYKLLRSSLAGHDALAHLKHSL
jgi:hypothetical protein